mmetsp:Transcript_114950/g.228805  ORF Transcript_114950/g.228805 Transcript_114950/m.228805 type:complete len:621 (-) Transcript_114950:272-2134(-)
MPDLAATLADTFGVEQQVARSALELSKGDLQLAAERLLAMADPEVERLALGGGNSGCVPVTNDVIGALLAMLRASVLCASHLFACLSLHELLNLLGSSHEVRAHVSDLGSEWVKWAEKEHHDKEMLSHRLHDAEYISRYVQLQTQDELITFKHAVVNEGNAATMVFDTQVDLINAEVPAGCQICPLGLHPTLLSFLAQNSANVNAVELPACVKLTWRPVVVTEAKELQHHLEHLFTRRLMDQPNASHADVLLEAALLRAVNCLQQVLGTFDEFRVTADLLCTAQQEELLDRILQAARDPTTLCQTFAELLVETCEGWVALRFYGVLAMRLQVLAQLLAILSDDWIRFRTASQSRASVLSVKASAKICIETVGRQLECWRCLWHTSHLKPATVTKNVMVGFRIECSTNQPFAVPNLPTAEAVFSEVSQVFCDTNVKKHGFGFMFLESASQAAEVLRKEAFSMRGPNWTAQGPKQQSWQYPMKNVSFLPSLGQYVEALELARSSWVEAAPLVSTVRGTFSEAPVRLREPVVQLEAAEVRHPAQRVATTRALRNIMATLNEVVALLDEWENCAEYAQANLPLLRRCFNDHWKWAAGWKVVGQSTAVDPQWSAQAWAPNQTVGR